MMDDLTLRRLRAVRAHELLVPEGCHGTRPPEHHAVAEAQLRREPTTKEAAAPIV